VVVGASVVVVVVAVVVVVGGGVGVGLGVGLGDGLGDGDCARTAVAETIIMTAINNDMYELFSIC
jgi:hypothetical protein